MNFAAYVHEIKLPPADQKRIDDAYTAAEAMAATLRSTWSAL